MSEPTDADRQYAREQQLKAELGTADGQCESCGAYRSDGQSPVLHKAECTLAERDGGTFRWTT